MLILWYKQKPMELKVLYDLFLHISFYSLVACMYCFILHFQSAYFCTTIAVDHLKHLADSCF